MKKHFNISFSLIFISFFLSGQTSSFYSNSNVNLNEFNSNNFTFLNKKYNISSNKKMASFSSFSEKEFFFSHLYGLGLHIKYANKLNFVLNTEIYAGDFENINRQYIDSLSIFPGFGPSKNMNQLYFTYQYNRNIEFDFGKGKHFIGSGYHSLLLSKNNSPYTYFKISTKFGKIQYYNLFTTFINHDMIDYGRKKHATIHYLDIAFNNYISLGFFEAILWQSKSINSNKGFEFAYMNPIIFYRPVEFSMQSNKGNALMGLNFNLLLNQNKDANIYSQLLIDDVNISRRKDQDANYSSGFFQNKIAYQIGAKTKLNDKIKILIEYNHVQPYTYGHRTVLQNYSHMNEALAHPLGANFKEVISVLEFNYNLIKLNLKFFRTEVGLDSISSHFGQNIFLSDFDASTGGQYSYGNFNGQGVLTTIYSIQPELIYSINNIDLFGSIFYRFKKSSNFSSEDLWFSFGFRTFPFQIYRDY